jgi:hypothetical protein
LDIAPVLATAGESLLIIQCARYGTFGFQRDEQIKGRSAGRRLLLIEPESPSLPAIAKWCLSLFGATHSGKFPIRDFRATETAFPSKTLRRRLRLRNTVQALRLAGGNTYATPYT